MFSGLGNLMSTVNVAEVGMTRGYIRAADHFLSSINPKVDPCQDFFEFACGKWVASNGIPKDLSSYGHFTAIREKVTEEMRGSFSEILLFEESGVNCIELLTVQCQLSDDAFLAVFLRNLPSETVGWKKKKLKTGDDAVGIPKTTLLFCFRNS